MSKKAKRESPRGTASPPKPALSTGRKKLFRWVSVLVLPVLVLLGVELALRMIGYGYPTNFFVRSKNGPPGFFAENPKFGWRFFPQRLARAPDPLRLSKTKPPGTRRIFVFGESAALGDPEPAYGFSRILSELLEERCPATKFEVVNVAMTAISSHVISRIAQDCLPFQGDIWIIYMGNNEVVGPFGAGSVFGSKAPPMPFIRAGLAARCSRLGQMMDAFWQHAAVGTRGSKGWEGMKMMLNDRIRTTDPALQRVYDHFGGNLEEILSMATRAGVKPIVCSVSSNLKDCPPFASLHKPDFSPEREADWTRLFTTGIELESRKEFAQALALYRQVTAIDDSYAELPFRMARCHQALGETTAAREEYARARDLDALRFRADTRINRIIRDTCARHAADGASYFDSEAVVTNACEMGIPGAECFWDHVHFNFTGNYRVASGLADRIASLLPECLRPSTETKREVLTEAECAERLALTDWDQRLVLERMQRRVQEPPFTGQLDHERLIERWSGLLAGLEPKTDREGLARAVEIYGNALNRRNDDWVLHHRLAFLLEAAGDFSGAEHHWKRVVELIPEYPDALFKLGDMNARESKLAEAGAFYREVLRLRPNSFEAMNGLGLVFMSEGKFEEAAEQFEQAIRIEPKFSQAHVNWGLLLSHRGMTAGAEVHFREALRGDPRSAGAHINLGNLLAAQHKHPEAIDHYLEAVKLRPNEAMVHLALADSLEAAGRDSDAITHYQQAIRLNPLLPEAHFNLGVALAKRRNLPEAIRCFEESARLNPDDPQAHLNLGVALAQQNRLREAIVHFQAVLRLDPANAAARQYLDIATGKRQPAR